MKKTVTIGLTGDVMIGRNVDRVIADKGYAWPWGNVLPYLKSTDANIINLETTLTRSNRPVYKMFNFKASPDKVNTLSEANITAVNLANNHILDFSQEGLIETIHTLHAAQIQYAGAGLNSVEASKPVLLNYYNIRIGLIGFTDNEANWKALADRPGTNFINISDMADRERTLYSISQLRKQTDIVIVSIHWGPNQKEKPEPAFIQFAHAMANAGANIIHGHSAHNFQGIEIYQRSLILYDTGDFIDDYIVHPFFRNDHSFLFIVQAGKTGITHLQLIPVLINKCRVGLAEGEDYRWCIQRMQQLSHDFRTTITDQGEVLLNPVTSYRLPGNR